MGVIETKTFKSGNSVAVRLPAELGFEAGTIVTIEKVGNELYVRPVVDADAERRAIHELADQLEEIWREVADHPDRGKRHPIEWPERGSR